MTDLVPALTSAAPRSPGRQWTGVARCVVRSGWARRAVGLVVSTGVGGGLVLGGRPFGGRTGKLLSAPIRRTVALHCGLSYLEDLRSSPRGWADRPGSSAPPPSSWHDDGPCSA